MSGLSMVGIATARRIEGLGSDLEIVSRGLGYQQMTHFVINKLAEPLLPVAWVGGEDGGVKRIASIPAVHAFDLAQMLGVMVSKMEKEKGGGDNADIWLFNVLLEGARVACTEYPSGRLAGEARIHLERLLDGGRFNLIGPMVYASAPYCSGE